MKLSIKQKELLAEFFGNLSVAWLAGGFIGPFVVGWDIKNVDQVVATSVSLGLILLIIMLLLIQEETKK